MRFSLFLALAWLCGAAMARGAAQVNLSWQDNSNNETRFELERAIGATGAFAPLASTAANATAYADTSVTGGTVYRYRVRAANGGGESAWSNIVTITAGATVNPPNFPPGSLSASIPGTLTNVSNRGMITVGDATMIPGFVITGGPLRVLIRVVGPTIGAAPFNVPGASSDPAFSVRNASNVEVGANDNWLAADATAMADVGAFALPAGSRDAAIVITLPAGNYTVITTGATGIATAEVYALP